MCTMCVDEVAEEGVAEETEAVWSNPLQEACGEETQAKRPLHMLLRGEHSHERAARECAQHAKGSN